MSVFSFIFYSRSINDLINLKAKYRFRQIFVQKVKYT